jgi:hypothetical protein
MNEQPAPSDRGHADKQYWHQLAWFLVAWAVLLVIGFAYVATRPPTVSPSGDAGGVTSLSDTAVPKSTGLTHLPVTGDSQRQDPDRDRRTFRRLTRL